MIETADAAWRWGSMKYIAILIATLMFAGCHANQKASSEAAVGDKAMAAHDNGEASEPASAKSDVLKGKVLERLNADRYSYLRLSTDSGEIWAAVLQTDAKTGDEVSVLNPMPMDGFESKTLNRRFDKIVFGMLDQQTQQTNAMQTLSKAHAGVSDTADAGPIKVQKAAGADGRTVAEVFAQKLQLKDRRIAVRGKVVKVNSNIMQKNWVHLRDGSGDPNAKTDDLTVTTQGSAAVGDTVLVNGVVCTDKNFGMGYVFPVIIEDASVMKQ
jgi:hypothetical protein